MPHHHPQKKRYVTPSSTEEEVTPSSSTEEGATPSSTEEEVTTSSTVEDLDDITAPQVIDRNNTISKTYLIYVATVEEEDSFSNKDSL